MSQLFQDMRTSILDKKMDMSLVFKLATENVAKFLKIFPRKGILKSGSDADYPDFKQRYIGY